MSPYWDLFATKVLLCQNIFYSIFSLYTPVTCKQKIIKIKCINLLENSKNSFRTTFLSTKTSERFFLRIIMTQFNPTCCCNKSEKLHALIFYKNKPHLRPILGPFWAKNFKAEFFYKHHFVQFQYAAIHNFMPKT